MSLEDGLDICGGAGFAIVVGLPTTIGAYRVYEARNEIKQGLKELYNQISEQIFPETPSQEIFREELSRPSTDTKYNDHH